VTSCKPCSPSCASTAWPPRSTAKSNSPSVRPYPAPELLYRLLSEEAASRRQRSLAYRLDQAHLPWRWTLESFPFERQPGINKTPINGLAEVPP
jgi:DNA replication protein DnaC